MKEKKKEEVSEGPVEGGYRCRASRTLLMFCIVGLAMTVQVSSATPAASVTNRNMEASKAMNMTEYVHSSTVEVMYEKHEEGREIPRDDPQDPKKA
jgi:hypothetical protein